MAPAGWTLQCLSTAGFKRCDGTNQDAFSYTHLNSGWVVCVACDGHGKHGEVISQRVARTLPLFLSRHPSTSSFARALPEAFRFAQADLEQSCSLIQAFSGTTVAVSCIHPQLGEAWVAHAGDSTVVLGDLATRQVMFSTRQHKAHHPAERRRLKACKARITRKKHKDGEIISRVYMPRPDSPGLAMS